MSEKVTVTCIDCGTQWEISKKSYNAYTTGYKKYKNHQWRCTKCSFKYHTAARSEAQHKRWEKLSPDEKQNALKPFIDGKAKFYSNMDEDKWEEFGKKVQQGQQSMSADKKEKMLVNRGIGRKKAWDKVSIDERKQLMGNAHDKSKEWWANLSDEERQQRLDFLHDNAKKWRDELGIDEIRARMSKIAERGKEWRSNLSDVERCNLSDKISNGIERYISSLTDEEKKALFQARSENTSKWWNSLSPEDKLQESIKRSKALKEFWDNLEINVKISKLVNSKNNRSRSFLEIKFEDYFNRENTKYYLLQETCSSNNSTFHFWDYGIFDGNNLVMLIDIDGTFTHFEKSDYISNLEYDERRGLSVPDGVKCHIIREGYFDEDFKQMLEMLDMEYQIWVDYKFQKLRLQPFPEPIYEDKVLVSSLDKLFNMDTESKYFSNLTKNPRLGDMFIYNFHQSIWREKYNIISPYDAFMNDETLLTLIRKGVIFQNINNKNKILQGFGASPIGRRAPFISAAKAKIIIHKYLQDYDIIFNPNNRYSGILLGTISSNKKYIGYEDDFIKINELERMKEFCIKYLIPFNVIIVNNSTSEYPCMFAEAFSDNEIDKYIERYKCQKYLILLYGKSIKYSNNVVNYIPSKSVNQEDQYLIIL